MRCSIACATDKDDGDDNIIDYSNSMIVGEGITGLLEYGDTTHYRDWVLQDFLR